MLQNHKPEKNPELEVLKIKYFYTLFLKEKKRYSPSLFCINQSTRKTRPRKVTLNEFKTVIYEYLKTYFFELYMNRKPMYFFLGGYMKLVRYLPWVRKQSRSNLNQKTRCSSSGAIGLYWYNRPSPRMYFMVKILKQSGSTNMITKIEQIFKENNNKDLLPIFTEEQKKGKKNQTLFRCIQT